MEKADAVIVGCGIAGGMLAGYLASSGFKVIAVEKRPQIGLPIRCAEAAGSREEISRYLKMDENWISTDINAARITSPGGKTAEKRSPGAGLILKRDKFDQAIADQARDRGADIRTHTEAVDLIIDGNRISGIRVFDHSRKLDYSIKAKITVGADGIECLVGRRSGLRRHIKPSEVHACFQYLMQIEGFDDDTIEFYVGRETAPGGYAWIFPKGNGLANVGLGIHPGMAGKLRAKDYLDRFINKHLPSGRVISSLAGATSGIKPLKTMVGEGVLLVGEAAGHNNPFSGGGIMNALEGAEEACIVLKDALEADDPSLQRLKKYDRRWHERNGKNLAKFAALRRIFMSLEDREMDSIISVIDPLINGKDLNVSDYAEFFKTAFLSAPGLLWKARSFLW